MTYYGNKKTCVEDVHYMKASSIPKGYFMKREFLINIKVTDNFSGEETEFKIDLLLETEPCRFGGFRRWLLCPNCLSKRMKLYLLIPNHNFYCRECLDLTYKSCQKLTMKYVLMDLIRLQKKISKRKR